MKVFSPSKEQGGDNEQLFASNQQGTIKESSSSNRQGVSNKDLRQANRGCAITAAFVMAGEKPLVSEPPRAKLVMSCKLKAWTLAASGGLLACRKQIFLKNP